MRLLHLYHDIMNLYGDYANVAALRRIILGEGTECEIDRKSLKDEVALSDYDFVFVGSGTEKNQKLVLEDIRRLKGQLEEYVSGGKTALFTGNSFEMLGKSITDCDCERYEGLGLFDFETTEQNKKRVTSDEICSAEFLDKPLVGFINKCSEISGISEPMLKVELGLSNREGEQGEGVRKGNLFCTHLTGPVLIKNPHFLEYIAQLVTGSKPQNARLEYEYRGYEITLSELRASGRA